MQHDGIFNQLHSASTLVRSVPLCDQFNWFKKILPTPSFSPYGNILGSMLLQGDLFARELSKQASFMAAVELEAHFDPHQAGLLTFDLWKVFEIFRVHAGATMTVFAVHATCLCSIAEPEHTTHSVCVVFLTR